MKLIAFDGFTFSQGGYSAALEDQENIGNFSLNPNTISRRAASGLMTGSTIGPRSITTSFFYSTAADLITSGGLTIENAWQRLMGLLDPTNDTPRTLTGQLNDGTTVSCQAVVLNPSASTGEDINILPVTFYTMDPFWREVSATTTTVSVSQNSAIALTNQGRARAYPEFKISYTAQRTTQTADVGWKYMRQVTIQNLTDEDWRDQPMTIDLGDTAAWVTATHALTNGDDVRIRYNGDELYRTLTNFNTKRTWAHFLVSIKSGASATYDVVYSNSAATTPSNMSTFNGTQQTFIAYDLEGDNGTATSGTTTTLTDTGKTWEVNRWKDGYLFITGGGASQRGSRIASNTANTITVNRGFSSAVTNTSTYVIWKSGVMIDGGRVTTAGASSIIDNGATTGWGTNQLQGATVYFLSGTTANPATMTVSANTDTSISFTSSFSVQPTVGDSYRIERFGVMNWNVDTSIVSLNHMGLYRCNKRYGPPGKVWPGQLTPGAWGPDTYLENNDSFLQSRPVDSGSAGGHAHNYRALLYAQRRVRQSTEYQDTGVGDGMSFYTPFRLQGAYFDYKYRNDHYVGKFVAAYKEPAGEDWQDVVTKSTLQNSSLTTVAAQYVDLDAVDNPTRFGMFALPYDGVEIPSTLTDDGVITAVGDNYVTDTAQTWDTNYWQNGTVTFSGSSTADPKTMTVQSSTSNKTIFTKSFTTSPTVGDTFTVKRSPAVTDVVDVRNATTMILFLDLTAFGGLSSSVYTVGAEVAIYDLNVALRLGGGADGYETPPYDRLLTGGTGHHVHLKSGEYLKIRCDPEISQPFAAIYNSSDVLQKRAAWAVRAYHHETNIDGANTALVSRDVMPVRPGVNVITNGAFDSNTSGWTLTQTAGTVTWSRDAGIFNTAAGSLKAAMLAGSTGKAVSTSFATVIGETYEVAYYYRIDDVSIDEVSFVGIAPGYVDGTTSTFHAAYLGISGGYATSTTISDTWIADGFQLIAADTSYSIGFFVRDSRAIASNVWIDDVTVKGAGNLYITETAMGTLSVSASYYQGYFG